MLIIKDWAIIYHLFIYLHEAFIALYVLFCEANDHYLGPCRSTLYLFWFSRLTVKLEISLELYCMLLISGYCQWQYFLLWAVQICIYCINLSFTKSVSKGDRGYPLCVLWKFIFSNVIRCFVSKIVLVPFLFLLIKGHSWSGEIQNTY